MNPYKIITIIPARGGSKRFPGKNIYPFVDKPLIAHSIEYSKNCPLVSATYVTTDDDNIKDVANKHGAMIINRPIELGGDFVSSAEVMKDAVTQLLTKKEDFDYVILLQPTNPLRPKSLIVDAIEIISKNHCESLFTVSRSDKKLGKIVEKNFVPWNYHFGQRSQDLEPLYFENGLLYITQKELLLNGIIMNEQSYPMVVNHTFGSVDIDTKDDLLYGEYIYQQYKE